MARIQPITKIEDLTVAWMLFNRTFQVRIQNKFIVNRKYNIPQSLGMLNDEEDRQRYYNSYTEVKLTTVGLAINFYNATPFAFVNQKDIEAVYTLLQRHLDEWAKLIANPLSGFRPPPAQDLKILNDFMQELKPIALHMQYVERQRNHVPEPGIDEFFSLFGGKIVEQEVNENLPNDQLNIIDAWERRNRGF